MTQNPVPTLSIVVPCAAAHAAFLSLCLRSLRAQENPPNYEIVVVNSHDDRCVAELATSLGARAIAAGSRQLTAGAARNLGVRASVGRFVAFIDSDCVAEASWLCVLYGALSSGEMVAVGGPVLNLLRFHPIATIDNLMQFIDQPPGRPAGRANAFPGCNMAIRKDAFLALGGFDEIVQPGEDTLLTNAAADRWPDRVQFLPTMRVRHRGRTSLPTFVAHQYDFGLNRGRYGLHLTDRQQSLGRSPAMAGIAACKRLAYFVFRTSRWDIVSLFRLVAFIPVVLIGLTAWACGFNAGCRTPLRKPA